MTAPLDFGEPLHPPQDFIITLLIIFTISTKALLPYIGVELIYSILHFSILIAYLLWGKVSDLIVYSLLVIGPLSAIFGFDIVWNQESALVKYSGSVPVIFSIGAWLIALFYMKFTRSN